MSREPIDTTLQELADELDFLTDWEDRIRHVMDLGRALPGLPATAQTEANQVRGCASKVWLMAQVHPEHPSRMIFEADSDAPLVRGLIALVLRVFSDRTPQEILLADPDAVFRHLGLDKGLTQQRANGLAAMIARIRAFAQAAAG